MFTPAANLAKVTNSKAKAMNPKRANGTNSWTNSFANRTNSFANRTNSFANGTKSIAKRTNSIAKTCNIVVPALIAVVTHQIYECQRQLQSGLSIESALFIIRYVKSVVNVAYYTGVYVHGCLIVS